MKNLLTYVLLTIFIVGYESPTNNIYEGSFGDKIQFEPTNFTSTCGRLIKTLNNRTHGHGAVSVSNSKFFIGLDSLSKLISSLTQFDVQDSNSFDTFSKTCDGVHLTTWNKPKNSTIMRFEIEKLIDVGNGQTNKISITDYYIKRVISPRQIQLRLVNNYTIDGLIIDSVTYHPLVEERLVGLDEVISKLDSIKINCN